MAASVFHPVEPVIPQDVTATGNAASARPVPSVVLTFGNAMLPTPDVLPDGSAFGRRGKGRRAPWAFPSSVPYPESDPMFLASTGL